MINMGDCVEVGGAIKQQADFSLAFSYPPTLLPIFGSSLWRDCIGTAYSVNICENTATRYLVRVQGCRRAVNKAVEAMRKLVSVQFTEGPREQETGDLSVQELERDVRRILGYIPPKGLYKELNRSAVAMLQEWLRMYREKCWQRTVGNSSADDSVIVIEDDENPAERIPTDVPSQVSCQNKENSEPCTASQKVDDVIIVAVVPGGVPKQPQVPQARLPKVAQKRPLHGPVKTNKKKKRKKTPQKNAIGRCGNKRMRQRPGGAPSTATTAAAAASPVVPTVATAATNAVVPTVAAVATATAVVPTECPPVPLPLVQRRLRPIVIDGSNVAMDHGRAFGNAFSCKGIQLCVEYFLNRGHTQVTAFVPRHRMYHNSVPHVIDHSILKQLEKKQHVTFTPSRRLDNGSIVSSYDDRFIVELASRSGGVVVSNDNYRDIVGESPEFASTVRERLLMFCFVGDYFMVPKDPLGRNGPSLDEFLAFPD